MGRMNICKNFYIKSEPIFAGARQIADFMQTSRAGRIITGIPKY
jgi:hypothetical protein